MPSPSVPPESQPDISRDRPDPPALSQAPAELVEQADRGARLFQVLADRGRVLYRCLLPLGVSRQRDEYPTPASTTHNVSNRNSQRGSQNTEEVNTNNSANGSVLSDSERSSSLDSRAVANTQVEPSPDGTDRLDSQVSHRSPDLPCASTRRSSMRVAMDPPGSAPLANKAVASTNIIALQAIRASTLEKTAFCQQAAYILAREIQNRPLSKEQKKLMWRVSDARTEVLKALPLGRSNVRQDYDACAEQMRTNSAMGAVQGTYRALAARQLKWDIPNGTSAVHISAALTAVAGSGSCGDHANVAMHLLARDLQPGERLLKQKHDNLDHAWVRVEGAAPKDGELGSGLAVILDAWADGPVIDPADGEFSKNNERISIVWTLDAQGGRDAYESFQRERTSKYEKPIADLARRIEQLRREKQKHSENSSGCTPLADVVLWSQIPVLDKTFLNRVKRVTFYGDVDGNLKNSALQIAREAPNWARYQDTEDLAERILTLARSLGKAEERPLIALAPLSLGLVPSADTTEPRKFLNPRSDNRPAPMQSASF